MKDLKISKLEWQENPIQNTMTWDEATKYVKSLGDGWRLPTIEELKKAYDDKTEGFQPISYFGSSIFAEDAPYASFVNFYYGSTYYYDKTHKYNVRCVRETK